MNSFRIILNLVHKFSAAIVPKPPLGPPKKVIESAPGLDAHKAQKKNWPSERI